jgi:hypothetical protein
MSSYNFFLPVKDFAAGVYLLVFSNQLCELLPFLPSRSLSCVNQYGIQYTYIQCVRGAGYGHRKGCGLGQINTCRKVPSQVKFLDDFTFSFDVYIVNLSMIQPLLFIDLKRS